MQTFISILSQLAWGVTVGGLTSAATFLAKAGGVGCGIAGCGYLLWRRRRGRPGKKPG